MKKITEFDKISLLVPSAGEAIPWEKLAESSLSPVFKKMEETYQNTLYHGERDVLTHTMMVCEEMIKQPEYVLGSDRDRIILFWAALLHDFGKTACTVVRDGVPTSPHHAARGANMARALLWKELGLCGSEDMLRLREAICLLIRYHSFPPYALVNPEPELKLLRIASNGMLAEDFTIEKLCALERADALGRIYDSKDDFLEKTELCAILAGELGCFRAPYVFTDDYSMRAFFKGKTSWHGQKLYNESWGKVILMAGLPGTGKDTWIGENLPHMPVISLDDIRRELHVLPTDNQSKVIATAHDRARELLRKKQPFIWNATSIMATIRNMQISLFEEYGASVETVFLETSWEEELSRNSGRDAAVPLSVIEFMLSRLTLPERFECESVRWLNV